MADGSNLTTQQQLNGSDFLVETFSSLENGALSLNEVKNRIINRNDVDDKFTALIEAQIVAHETKHGNGYLEAFNDVISSEFDLPATKRIEVLSKDEFEAVKEDFAQTVNTTSGGFVALPQIAKTNFTNLLDDIFYESSILADCTLYPDGPDNEEVRVVTNTRSAVTGNETVAGVYADNTVDAETLNPNRVRIVDVQEVTRNFQETSNAVDSGTMVNMMLRSCINQAETNLVGAVATAVPAGRDGVVYPILNALASTGTNKGALVVPLVTVGVTNHVDAINYLTGQLPVYDLSDLDKYKVYGNWFTINTILRTLDANTQYYFDKETKQIKSVLIDAAMKILSATPNYRILVANMKRMRVKRLRAIKFESRISSLKDNKAELCVDTFLDALPTFAYKAIPTKNEFRTAVLEADNNYVS